MAVHGPCLSRQLVVAHHLHTRRAKRLHPGAVGHEQGWFAPSDHHPTDARLQDKPRARRRRRGTASARFQGGVQRGPAQRRRRVAQSAQGRLLGVDAAAVLAGVAARHLPAVRGNQERPHAEGTWGGRAPAGKIHRPPQPRHIAPGTRYLPPTPDETARHGGTLRITARARSARRRPLTPPTHLTPHRSGRRAESRQGGTPWRRDHAGTSRAGGGSARGLRNG